MLKILVSEATILATLNALKKLAIDAEDKKLGVAANQLANEIQAQTRGARPSTKIRLMHFVDLLHTPQGMGQPPISVGHLRLGQGTEAILKFCDQMLKTEIPQWQILARNAGWKPPEEQ